MTTRNTVPKLVTTLRLNMGDIAGWTQMSTSMIQKWQAGAYRPQSEERDRLIAHVRDHAHKLLALADAVESEGNVEV